MRVQVSPALTGLSAFARALWLSKRLATRAQVDAFQQHQLAKLLPKVLANAAAYDGRTDLVGAPLSAWPITDKTSLMADFAGYNRLGLDAETAWEVYHGHRDLPGFSVGASTGTSGNRGLFLVSDTERFFWLGVMLAKALPQVVWQAHRVALVLPTTSRLYETANESKRLTMAFFDVGQGVESHIPALSAFAPTVIIGSPHALRILAEADTNLAPAHVFSGAEVLDPLDRTIIEARWGLTVREIYMATEGLFGIACSHGTLHLVEDHVHIELAEDIGSALKRPIITDFTRSTQYMVRYAMNDLLEVADGACVCGSPLRAIKAVHGRADDVFVFSCGTSVTPDVVRNAIVTVDPRIDDFRAVQTAPNTVRVHIPGALADLSDAVRNSLDQALNRAGVALGVEISVLNGPMPPLAARKLRRVQRLWLGDQSDD